MKNLKYLIIFLLIFTAWHCSNKDEAPNLGILEVKLELSSGLSDIPLKDVPIKIVNTIDNSEKELKSDVTGSAKFSNLPYGTYNISILQSTNNYALSGTLNNVVINSRNIITRRVKVNAVNPNAGFVIKEIYAAGAGDNYVSLFKDQFIEIFNNSSEVLYADGMYLANLYGETGSSGQKNPISMLLPIGEYIYANAIDKIPGSGKDYPVQPGKSIVIALNAINFKEGNKKPEKAVDNTDATFERYSIKWLQEQGRDGNAFFDFDNPKVPNMINIYIFGSTNLYLMNTYGAGIVLLKPDITFSGSDLVDYDPPTSSDVYKLMKIPANTVIDGVEILENAQAAKFKRLPKSIDAGFSYLSADGDAFYTGKSSIRIIDESASKRFGRTILQDTNNSTVDFKTINFPDKYGYNK